MLDVEIIPKADRETPERLETADDGSKSGYRCFIARTVDPAAADAAAELLLPIGKAWSESLPGLTLRSRSVRYLDGTDDPASARRGICLIDCLYRTPKFGRLPIPAAAGVAFTQWQKQTTQTTVYYSPYDAEATSLPVTYGLRINNGDGAPRNVTIRSAVVTVYKSDLSIDLVRAATGIEDRVNSERVTLPPMEGVGPSLQFEAGELLCMGTTFEREGSLWKLVTELAVSVNGFDVFWQPLDQNGEATGTVIESPVYLSKAYPGELFG